MDSGKSWSGKNFVNKCKDKEITILWSHHETQLSRNEYHPRNLIMKEEKRTKNIAIADKPCDAFRGQSRSPNMVPFHMLGMVYNYCITVL